MAGCTAVVDDGQGVGESSTSTTLASTSTSTGSTGDEDLDSSSAATDMASATTMSSADTSTGSVTTATTSGAAFIYGAPDTTGPSPFECQIEGVNCPDEEKCVLWANDGGDMWNGSRCVPIAPEPSAVGEPCTFEDSIYTGIDTCAGGLHCLPVEEGAREGICRAYCMFGDLLCEGEGTSCQYVQDPYAACLPE